MNKRRKLSFLLFLFHALYNLQNKFLSKLSYKVIKTFEDNLFYLYLRWKQVLCAFELQSFRLKVVSSEFRLVIWNIQSWIQMKNCKRIYVNDFHYKTIFYERVFENLSKSRKLFAIAITLKHIHHYTFMVEKSSYAPIMTSCVG